MTSSCLSQLLSTGGPNNGYFTWMKFVEDLRQQFTKSKKPVTHFLLVDALKCYKAHFAARDGFKTMWDTGWSRHQQKLILRITQLLTDILKTDWNKWYQIKLNSLTVKTHSCAFEMYLNRFLILNDTSSHLKSPSPLKDYQLISTNQFDDYLFRWLQCIPATLLLLPSLDLSSVKLKVAVSSNVFSIVLLATPGLRLVLLNCWLNITPFSRTSKVVFSLHKRSLS